jgi:hypothetical protein
MNDTVTYPINEMLVDYHPEAIARDFVIYRIEPKPNQGTPPAPPFHQNPILDFPIKELKALSSAYIEGKCFVLFARKDVPRDARVQEAFTEAYPRYHCKRLYDSVLSSSKMLEQEFGYHGYLLCQLLLASVCNYKSPELRCHNVQGQIYIPVTPRRKKKEFSQKDQEVCLHISVTRNMTLQLRTTTFQKIDFQKARLPKPPYYYIGRNNMQIYDKSAEKISKRERPNLYIRHSFRDHHNTIEFLNLKDRKTFYTTKLGIFTQFMEEARERLADYLTISFREYPFRPFPPQTVPQISLPETASWQAVDMLQEGTSTEELQWFCRRVSTEFPAYTITPVDTIDPSAKTLLLYYNQKYYKKHKLPDPSLPHRANLHTQEITLENLKSFFTVKKKNDTPPVVKVLPKLQTEFQIKEDIENHRFTLFHPGDYIHSPWTYVSYEREPRPDPAHPGKKRYFYHFYELRATPESDAIQFRYFNESSADLSYPERCIVDLTRSFYASGEHGLGIRMGYETLEGFFYTEETEKHPYLIIRSGNFLLPDCRSIPLADPDYLVEKSVFWNALAREKEGTDDAIYRQEIEQWAQAIKSRELEECPLQFSLKFLKKAFGDTEPIVPRKSASPQNQTSGARKARGMGDAYGLKLNAFIGRLTGGHYFYTTRKKKDLAALGLDGHLKGHYCILPRPVSHGGKIDETRKAIAYVAGYQLGAKYQIPQATIIRLILSSAPGTPMPENLQQEYFAQLMVDHIRTSSYTVKPFPFKYLREFSRYYNAAHHIAIDQPTKDED